MTSILKYVNITRILVWQDEKHQSTGLTFHTSRSKPCHHSTLNADDVLATATRIDKSNRRAFVECLDELKRSVASFPIASCNKSEPPG